MTLLTLKVKLKEKFEFRVLGVLNYTFTSLLAKIKLLKMGSENLSAKY